jgi:potassium efflux system protein
MKIEKCRLIALVLAIVVSWPLASHTAETDGVTIEGLQELKAKAEADSGITGGLRDQIVKLCDDGIAALESAESDRAAAIDYARDRDGVDRQIANLKAELEQQQPPPRLHLPENPTVEEAEDALARERARLAANLAALREQQQIADDRTRTRSEVSQRLGELDLELELLNRELRAQLESTAQTGLKTAVRFNILARREATNASVERLRARLALLADRSALIPLYIDLAQRQVETSREQVELHAREAQKIRADRARESLHRVRDLSRQLAARLPQLSEIASETEDLAEMLWGGEGIVILSEQTVKGIAATRNYQMQLDQISELTARKFSAYGHRGSVQRWWPEVPDGFPEIGTLETVIEYLDEEIPDVEHRLITAEQSRSKAHSLARSTLSEISEELGDEMTPELELETRTLLAIRQDVLDEVIQRGGRYSNELVEYRTVAGIFHAQLEDINRFLFSHVLWSRSVPRPIIPRLGDLAAAAKWLTSADHLGALSAKDFKLGRTVWLTTVLLLLIVSMRRPLRRRLAHLSERAADPASDSLGLTFSALAVTALLAAPLPLLLYIAASMIERFGGSVYWYASADAMFQVATVAALLELIRQIFASRGLAEIHFGWPTSATRPLYRGLLATEAVGLPLLYVALHFGFAGMNLSSAEELVLYNNTLGRMAFIAALSVFGLAILGMLRPERKAEPADHDMRVPWPRQFSEYAFPTAFLGAYPIVLLATIVPALLAAFGYYITGLLLAYQMLRTLLLAVAVLIVGGVVHRNRTISQRRMLAEQSGDDADEAAKTRREVEAAEKQARHLFRFAVITVLVVGLYTIWSDALPMLQMLKRVQLFPRVALLEPTEDPLAALVRTPETPDASTTAAPEDAGDSNGGSAVPIPGASPSGSTATTEDTSTQLTLWGLMEAILAAVITLVLVRNLPGVIEIVLKRRTTLDAGARVAFSTLVRYSTTIIGSIAVFGLLGIGWSKVQWLAAALTFGLGFGLQEIVANFVSGLILLIERPVRVGDVVTIGNLMGKVSRIQIRATTITLWDRSEMIVPNKEFITTKLVNWTLSDSKRRIEIPLRVAYGADLEQVKQLLVGAAEAHSLVLEDPAPQALLLTFGDDAINFELRFVVDFGNGIQAKDDVQMAIDKSFKDNGIEFALPQLKLNLPGGRSTIPPQPEESDRNKNGS